MASTIEIGVTREGITQLTRRWEAADPWASMLIVHGIAEHSGRYEATGQRLADAGIECWSFDMVGFGGSGGHRGFIETWSMHLAHILDQLAPVFGSGRPTVLLGHSLGGLAVASYALSRHRQTDYVVLSAPALDSTTPQWQRALAPVMARILPRLRIPNLLKAEQLSRDPAVGERYFADPLVYTNTTAQLGHIIFEEMERVRDRLSSYSARTLVIHGGKDTIVPPAATVPLGELSSVDRREYAHMHHELFNEPEGPEVVDDVVAWVRAQVGMEA